MLKTIDPLLTPELLFVLAAMGHGDDIAVVDANFPADSMAGSTCHGRVVSVAGASMPAVVDAILSVLPLDDYVAAPVRTMAATTEGQPEVQKEVQALIDADARPPLAHGSHRAHRFLRGRTRLLRRRADR